MNEADVNFTMLVRDRPRLTRQALKSLGDCAGMNTTILDDRSQDDTGAILMDWCKAHRAMLWPNGNAMGTGDLRNTVIDVSEQAWGRGRYLYLSDNDVCFTKGWLDVLVNCYELAWRAGFRVLGGYNHPFNQAIATWTTDGAHEVRQVQALTTQSMLMSWDVWDRFGPFVQTPVDRVCQSEDVEFCQRVQAAGYRVGVVAPALVVATGVTNTFGEAVVGADLIRAACPAGVLCE